MNNNNISGYDPNTGQPIINNSNNYTNSQPVKNDKSILWIILISVVIFPVLLIVFFIFVFSSISSNSNKLVCKSSEGNITIMYNESSITGYFATGIRYDLDGQKEIAKQIGTDSYISQFTAWFETNTTGTCSVQEKSK